MSYTVDYTVKDFKFESLTLGEVITALQELTAQLLIELEAGKKTNTGKARARKITGLLGKAGKAYRAMSIKA